jgi:hypothetical protein
VESVIAHYREVDAGNDALQGEVEAFVGELVAAGLLEPFGEGDAPASEPVIAGPGDYQPPCLEKFEDMSDLIMLDPVHDVSDVGWPYRPAKIA